MSSRRAALVLALAALAATLWTLYEPGLTVDEPINVGHGKAWTATLRRDGWAFFRTQNIYLLWRTAHEHPPLARGLIGWAHALLDAAPLDPRSFQSKSGRWISALAFAWIVYLVTRWAWRDAGPIAGWTAGVAAIETPRLFAHAHLASPEVINSAFILAALSAATWTFSPESMTRSRLARLLRAALAGLVLGLALLTKLTSVLAPLAVSIAVLGTWRTRGLAPLFVWGMTGLVVFVAGWPWLWPYDFPGYSPGWLGSFERLREFVSVGVDRPTVYVWYLGRQLPSAAERVPWHFVWVFVVATVPVGLTALELIGLTTAWRQRASFSIRLLATMMLVILGFFSLPIERYDGERLFLMFFPLAAVLAGLGGARLVETLRQWVSVRSATGILIVVLAMQAYGLWKYHPYQLSYYSAVVGGLHGADRLGLEATYWGDSLSEDLLDRLSKEMPQGASAVLFPSLYGGHAVRLTSPGIRARGQTILPGDMLEKENVDWAILFNRKGYIMDPAPAAIQKDWRLVDEISRDGVWLTRIYRRPREDGSNNPREDSPKRSAEAP